MSLSKKGIGVRTGFMFLGVLAAIMVGELLTRIFRPQNLLTPRYDFQEDIGLINFPNVVMKHRIPHAPTLYYTVNSERYRGQLVDPHSPEPKIVVLGDSFSFGTGVQDQETYSYVLNQELSGRYRVVNLANAGWGLTHQINRFLTFGERFHPKWVILQFSANDPHDGTLTPSIAWNEKTATFEFRKVTQKRLNFVRKVIASFNPLYVLLNGHSHLYNYLRNPVYKLLGRRDRAENFPEVKSETRDLQFPVYRTEVGERFYNELLEPFVALLHSKGIGVIFMTAQAPEDTQLDLFPIIRQKVFDLDHRGLLTYLDTSRWFTYKKVKAERWRSPEGHLWGVEPHRIVGVELARWLLARSDTSLPHPPSSGSIQ